jgi:VanZ family protein
MHRYPAPQSVLSMPPSHTPAARPSTANLVRLALFSRKGRLSWALFLAVTVGYVLHQALTPYPHGPNLGWDKLNHAAAFATLAFASLFALREQPHPVFWTSFGLMALGLGIELGQMQVPGRSADWNDVAADAVGIGFGLLLAMRTARRLDRRQCPRTGADNRSPRSTLPAQPR